MRTARTTTSVPNSKVAFRGSVIYHDNNFWAGGWTQPASPCWLLLRRRRSTPLAAATTCMGGAENGALAKLSPLENIGLGVAAGGLLKLRPVALQGTHAGYTYYDQGACTCLPELVSEHPWQALSR